MYGPTRARPGFPLQFGILAVGLSASVSARYLLWLTSGLDRPLFTTLPAVFSAAVAFGPRGGAAATALAILYMQFGLSHADYSALTLATRVVMCGLFISLSLLVCAMVGLLQRANQVDMSSLLKELGQSEERLKAVIASLEGHRICLIDNSGRIVGWMGGPCKLTGWHERDMLGMDFAELYPAGIAGQAMADKALVMALDRGRSHTVGLCRTRQGDLFPAETTVTTLKHGEGFCAVIRDLSVGVPARTLAVA